MNRQTYEEIKANIKGQEEKFYSNCEEARHQCDLLIDKYFENMKSDICNVVKDFSRSDIEAFLKEASNDKDIDIKTYGLVLACWTFKHDKEEEREEGDAGISDIVTLLKIITLLS